MKSGWKGLNREIIVAATLAFLRENPSDPLTIARASAAVGATPMAIYKHFRDVADLSDAIVAEVLKDLDQEMSDDADWREQLRAWMYGVYRRLQETPQSATMLRTAQGLPVAWVRATTLLRRVLIAAGISGQRLAEGSFWISITVSGFAQQTVGKPLTEHIEGTLAAIAELELQQSSEFADFAVDVPRVFRRGFEILVERTLASIEALQAEEPG